MIAALLLQLACCLSFFWLLVFYWRRVPFYQLAARIPLIEGHIPFLGQAHKFVGAGPKEFYQLFKTITKPAETSPRAFWMGTDYDVVVDDLEQLQDLLSSRHCVDKADFYKHLFFTKGLLLSGGSLWRSHRKLIEPAFNLSILKSFIPIFNEKTKIFLNKVEERVDGSMFDISELLTPLALDNILSTSTGLEKNIQTEKNNEYLEHCIAAMNVGISKLSKFWLHCNAIYKFTKFYALEKKHVWGGMYGTADELIKQKDAAGFDANKAGEEDSRHKPQIFIDQLLKRRDALTNDDIVHEVNTIIVTGFETVSNTMSLITLILALHPEVQEKVFEELQIVFETVDEEVTEEHLNKLNYMDLVIKETMRFWTPIPFIARLLTKEMQIGNCLVPKGSNIVVPFIHIHRNMDIWGQDADEFKPERFTKENFEKIHPFAYSPFSRGPRNCVGYKYAMMSMKVILAHLYRNFKFSTTLKLEDITFEYMIMMRVIPGYFVSVEKRGFMHKSHSIN